jgi:hypothetical protein
VGTSVSTDPEATGSSYFYSFLSFSILAMFMSQGFIAPNCYAEMNSAFPRSAAYWVKLLNPPMILFSKKQLARCSERTRWLSLAIRRKFGIADQVSGEESGEKAGKYEQQDGNEYVNYGNTKNGSTPNPIVVDADISHKKANNKATIHSRKTELQQNLKSYIESKNGDILLADRDEFLGSIPPVIVDGSFQKVSSTLKLLATRIFDEYVQRELEKGW